MRSLITIIFIGIIFKWVITFLSYLSTVRWEYHFNHALELATNFWKYGLSTEVFFYTFLAIVIPFVIISSIRSNNRANRWYQSFPTASEYAQKYLKGKTGNGYACSKCGSKSIRNWGRASAQDAERIFICNHCGSHLYRN